jgi:hypothetical protein
VVQALHIGQQPVLDVENHSFRVGPGYVVPQFFARAGYMHCEVRAKPAGQGPGHFRIFLENYYVLSHTSPVLQPSPTADVNVRLGLRGGWENHNSTDI